MTAALQPLTTGTAFFDPDSNFRYEQAALRNKLTGAPDNREEMRARAARLMAIEAPLDGGPQEKLVQRIVAFGDGAMPEGYFLIFNRPLGGLKKSVDYSQEMFPRDKDAFLFNEDEVSIDKSFSVLLLFISALHCFFCSLRLSVVLFSCVFLQVLMCITNGKQKVKFPDMKTCQESKHLVAIIPGNSLPLHVNPGLTFLPPLTLLL